VPGTAEPQPLTIRERYRAQVRAEVKQAALAQLAQAGPGGISISAIGKQLGVSGPALYRYFASRDELLTELVIDAYHDLANALTAATSHVSGSGPRAKLEALARAYRFWALVQPYRYQLLFGPPLPGYDAHAQRPIEAAQKAMNLLLDILGGPGTAPPSHRSRWLPSWQPGPGRITPASTQPPPCAPSSSGAACTASSASRSPGTSHPWAWTPASSSRPSWPRSQPDHLGSTHTRQAALHRSTHAVDD
jgi:AcrR family transcriptional regulator